MTKINEPSEEWKEEFAKQGSELMIKLFNKSYLTKQAEKMIELYDTAEPTVHWPKTTSP